MNARKMSLLELEIVQSKLEGRITEMQDLINHFKSQRIIINLDSTYEELLALKEKYKGVGQFCLSS